MITSTQDSDACKTARIFRAINGIAFQTSLLALSAALEDTPFPGAGSGTAGGFAAKETPLFYDSHTVVKH